MQLFFDLSKMPIGDKNVAQQACLWVCFVLIIIIIIAMYVHIKKTLNNQAAKLELIVKHENFKGKGLKENYAVIPSQLAMWASSYNDKPNNLLPTAQAEDWLKGAQPPMKIINNDRYGNQSWLASNYGGKYGNNMGTAAATGDDNIPPTKTEELGANGPVLSTSTDGVSNEISSMVNPNLDTSQAESSVLNVTQEDLAKAGANAITKSNLGYDNRPANPEAAGPVITQSGLNPEGFASRGLYTMNTRTCPPSLANEHFMVRNKPKRQI